MGRSNRSRLVVYATLLVVLGCVAVSIIEVILRRDRQGQELNNVVFTTFCMVTSFAVAGPRVLTRRQIPLRYHGALALANYGYTVLSNWPLKNGGLLVSMVVGVSVEQKRYSAQHLGAAIAVTLGILVTVWSNMKPAAAKESSTASGASSGVLCIGVLLMFAGLLVRALGQTAQKQIVEQFGKPLDEIMFYSNALCLPLLLVSWRRRLEQARSWSFDLTEDLAGVAVPVLWLYLAITIVCNYFVTMSLSQVVALAGPVKLNLFLAMQRFAAIVVSATILNAPPYPSALMWVGSVMVLLGCVAFISAPPPRDKAKVA